MKPVHPLENVLYLQLASDLLTVQNLPSVISSLTPEVFSPSPHLTKWVARISSLLHSKDQSARWAGLCIALQTARSSRDVMLQSAQGWTAAILPMLSRNESVPLLKITIRLLSYIFTATIVLPEFQRQVVTPNIPKFSLALIALVQNKNGQEIKLLAMDTLSVLVTLYPSLHRSLHQSMSNCTLQLLNGSSLEPSPASLVKSAARLHAALPVTGGKVGSATLWRKSVDVTIAHCWTTFSALRTTYSYRGKHPTAVQPTLDPLVASRLNLDQLRCGVVLLCELLYASTSRPVAVPIASLVELCTGFLQCTLGEEAPDHTDFTLRALEEAVIPAILESACELINHLSKCVRQRLTPYLSNLLSFMTFHLEQQRPISQHIAFVKLLPVLLESCHPPYSPFISGRIIKVILPLLSIFLSKESEVQVSNGNDTGMSKKGRKRSRTYEGDELFQVGKEVVCSTALNNEIILAALDALPYLLRSPDIPQYLRSITSRVLLSLLISLPQMSTSFVSVDPTLRDRILQKVISLCVALAAGASAVTSKSLALVVEPAMYGLHSHWQSFCEDQRVLDVLLHPRVPPLLRPLPPLNDITLIRGEKSTEEKDDREAMGLAAAHREPSLSTDLYRDSASKSQQQQILMSTAQPVSVSLPHTLPVPATLLHPATMNPKIPKSSTPSQPAPDDMSLQCQNQAGSTSAAVTSHTNPSSSLELVLPPGPLQGSLSHVAEAHPAGINPAPCLATYMPIDEEEMPSINMESDSE